MGETVTTGGSSHEGPYDWYQRGLELLAPLPPENIAGLVGFVIEMTEKDKTSKAGRGG